MKPYKKFLLIEDGSVDLETLSEDLQEKNPEIRIIVYRQGSAIPQLLSLENEQGAVTAIGFMAEEDEEGEECTERQR